MIVRPSVKKRQVDLNGYRRIIECTTRQIVNEYGIMAAEHALRETGAMMRKEVIRSQEPR